MVTQLPAKQTTTLGAIRRLQVGSETGRLQQAILHRPGRELELMSPSNHDSLLFDDILLLEQAQAEHGVFSGVLERLGVQVLSLETLLAEALPTKQGAPLNWREDLPGDDLARWDIESVIYTVIQVHKHALDDRGTNRWLDRYYDMLQERLRTTWREHGAAGLARALVEGFVATPEMANYFDDVDPFLLTPIPDILFMRDPAAVVGPNVIVSSMAKPARRRESLIMSLIFRGVRRASSGSGERPLAQDFWFDPFTRAEDGRDAQWTKVEGGDVLAIHENILAIGMSERTTKEMLSKIAQRLILDPASPIEVAYAVLMPMQRSTMHLDTIFTMTSESECLIYPPMIHPDGIERVRVLRLSKDRTGDLRIEEKPSLVAALTSDLRRYTGCDSLELTPMFCGGHDIINQDREQWTDGANVLALAPGVVVGYDRNFHTFEELGQYDYQRVEAQKILDDPILADEILAEIEASIPGERYRSSRRKYAIAIPGAELSRARGGPRCMTMPLVREPLRWR